MATRLQTLELQDLFSHLDEVARFLELHGPLALCRAVGGFSAPGRNLPHGPIATLFRNLYLAESRDALVKIVHAFEAKLRFPQERAVQEVVCRMTRLADVYILPAIERRRSDATA